MDQLVLEFKKELIERLNLEGMTTEELDENMPLFGGRTKANGVEILSVK